jgi:hypothetical protein
MLLADFVTRTILPKADIDALMRLEWSYGGDLYATDTQPETNVSTVPSNGGVGATLPAPALVAALLYFEPPTPFTFAPNDTNYATWNVYKRTLGGTRTLLATGTTQATGGIGALTPRMNYPLALQGSALVSYGDEINVEMLKTGTGVQVPPFKLLLPYGPTYIDASLAMRKSHLYARLAKRYDTSQLETSPPEVFNDWLTAVVTYDCYRRRGYNPGSEQDKDGIGDAYKQAMADVTEAANSETGLFDLPLLQSAPGTSGVSRSGPRFYTETSPYVAADQQERIGLHEDARRNGSYGTGDLGGFGGTQGGCP